MYTHFSPTGAARLEKFYMTPELMARKIGTEKLPVAFTDHTAVILLSPALNFMHTDRGTGGK
jgi:hypothetical protein